MMPPTSIDGTDITAATIDGTDVTEITVDGDTVFTAGPSNLPVAYSNLIAWYPFDSATYGGSNADDVTAIIGGSGDDTAYDGTVNGATYQSSGGVTDINGGANSGAFSFDGVNDDINTNHDFPFLDNGDFTITCWFNLPDSANKFLISNFDTSRSASDDQGFIFETNSNGNLEVQFRDDTDGTNVFDWGSVAVSSGTDHFGVLKHDDSANNYEVILDDSSTDSITYNRDITSDTDPRDVKFGSITQGDGSKLSTDLNMLDDVRFYNSALTSAQITNIYNNTKP